MIVLNAQRRRSRVPRPEALLDAMLGDLRVVWATFKAVSTYFGPAGQMIRASDSATEDLQILSNGEVDESQISTFAGGGTVYFLPYDQTGNGFHATQATASKRPLICNAGTVCKNADGQIAAQFVGASRSHWTIPDAFTGAATTALMLIAGEMGADGNSQTVSQYRGPVVAMDILLNEFGNDGQTQISQSSVDIQANQTFEITYPQAIAAHFTTAGAGYLLVGGVDHGTDASCTFGPSGTVRNIGSDATSTINGTVRFACVSEDADRTKLLAIARWLHTKASTTQYDPASIGEQAIPDVSTFNQTSNYGNWMSFSHPIDSWVNGSSTRYQAIGYWNADLEFSVALRSRPSGGNWTGFTVHDLAGVTVAGTDYHDAPRLALDGNGVLWIFDPGHTGTQHAWRSDDPVDAWDGSSLTEVTAIGSPSSIENQVGYPTPFRLADGNLALLWRDGSSGDGDTYLWVHNAGTDTWASASGLTDGLLFSGSADDINAYHHQKPVVDASGWVHFGFWIREDTGSSEERDIFHVKWNPSTGAWEQADGTSQTVPITDANKNTVKSFGVGVVVNVGTTAMTTDADDSCLFVFSASDDADGLRVLEIEADGTVTEHLLPYAITTGRRAVFVDSTRLYIVASLADKKQGIRIFRSGAGDYSTWTAATVTEDFTGMATPHLDELLYRDDGEFHMVTPVRPFESSTSAAGFPAHVLIVDPSSYSFA